MSYLENFINGMVFAAGTFIVSTVFGYLMFKYSKNWITKTLTELWATIRSEGVKLDGITFDAKVKTKKIFKKKGKELGDGGMPDAKDGDLKK